MPPRHLLDGAGGGGGTSYPQHMGVGGGGVLPGLWELLSGLSILSLDAL